MRLMRSMSVATGLLRVLAALAIVAVPMIAHAQQATVTGRVTTGTNEPLTDARVMVVNTSIIVPTSS